jgi:hypothetical protein
MNRPRDKLGLTPSEQLLEPDPGASEESGFAHGLGRDQRQ